MTPEQEKKLQRILQIVTGTVLVLSVGITLSLVDFKPKASVLDGFEKKETPIPVLTDTKPTKVPRIPTIKNPLPVVTEQPLANTASHKRTPAEAEQRGDDAFLSRNFVKAEAQYGLARAAASVGEGRAEKDSSLLRIKETRSLLSQRKIIEAQKLLDEVKDDHHLGLELYRGVVKALLNESEASRTILENVASKKSGDALEKAFVEKAAVLVKAFDEWKFTTDGRPEHLQVLLAKAFDEIGEFELAAAMALDAIKTYDSYRDAWVVLGHAYLASNQFSESQSAFEKALRLDSQHSESYFYLSFALRGLNNFEGSYENLEKAVTYGMPRSTFLREHEAFLLYEMGTFDEALSAYYKVLQEKGKSATPDEYVRPMYILIEIFNKKEDAKTLGERLLAYHPENAMSYNLLGWAELHDDNVKEAAKLFRKALEFDPTLPAIYFNLGQVYEKQKALESAEKFYERALALAREKRDESMQMLSSKALNKVHNQLHPSPNSP